MKLDELELSVRAYCALKRAGITTTEDLCNMTAEDVIKVRNLGRRCLEEVISVMKSHGLKFRESEDEA
jgi:DNA-directed RNA polymerase subunit alpha